MIYAPVIDSSRDLTLDELVADWLYEKRSRTGSVKTNEAYSSVIRHFRMTLATFGLDLDSAERLPETLSQQEQKQRRKATVRDIRRITQGWAARGFRGGEVASATTNQRLTIISSCYEYLIRMEHLTINPVHQIKRVPMDHPNAADPFSAEELCALLQAIDCSTLEGLRDYTLLLVALATGRRLSEIAGLYRKHITPRNKTLRLTWQRTKGGKTMTDDLDVEVKDVLATYLQVTYQFWLDQGVRLLFTVLYSPSLSGFKVALVTIIVQQMVLAESELPVWFAFHGKNPFTALRTFGVSMVCKRHLGTSKFHTTRHTFATMMEDLKASPSEIAHRLGHSSLQSLLLYLDRLRKPINPHAAKMSELLGIEQSHSWQQWKERTKPPSRRIAANEPDAVGILTLIEQMHLTGKLVKESKTSHGIRRASVAIKNYAGLYRSLGRVDDLLHMDKEALRTCILATFRKA